MTGLKIDFQNVSLQGRSSELHLIDTAFQKLISGSEQAKRQAKTSIVLLEGQSGTGKSFLVESWYTTVVSKTRVFASGKFDLNRKHSASYEVISKVITELCEAVDDTENLVRSFEDSMGDELGVVLDTLASLPTFLQEFRSERSDGSMNSSRSFSVDEVSIHRFKFLFLEFFRCICRSLQEGGQGGSPFVIFFDDLQYADDNSSQLVDSIVGDFELQGFLLLLSTHVDPDRATVLQENAEKVKKEVDVIRLGDFRLEDVNAVTSEVTLASKEKTLPLSELILDKTGGNPFFVLQFLHLLHQRELLVFSGRTCCWEWNLETVRHQTQLTNNVAAIVHEQVSALDTGDQELMELAAYLGATFCVDDVCQVQYGMKAAEGTRDLLEAVEAIRREADKLQPSSGKQDVSLFEKATDMGLLEDLSSGTYKFAHDSIQNFFLSSKKTSTSEAMEEFGVRIGATILCLAQSSSINRENLLFASVEVLDQCLDAVCKGELASKVYLATINRQAAQIAIKRSAFVPASSYLESGMTLLKATADPWSSHYELFSQLALLALEVTLACGHHDRCQELAGDLLKNGQTADKVDAYFGMAFSLQAQNKNEEAFTVAIDGLRLLGEHFPSEPKRIHVAWSARVTRHILKGKSGDSMDSLPMMSCRGQSRMKLLSALLIISYLLSRWTFVTLVARRMIIHTVRYGLCKYSPLAFAAHAYKLVEENHYQEAYEYGELSNRLINRLSAKANLPLATFFLAAFVNHLHQPMHLGVRRLKRSYQIGMESGRTDMAFLCASTDISYQFTVAYPLEGVLRESLRYFNLCRQYNQDATAGEFLIMGQLAANLRGESANATEFDGEFMGVEAAAMMSDLKAGPLRKFWLYMQTVCCTFMGDWTKALAGMDELKVDGRKTGKNGKTSSHYSFLMANAYSGIIYFKAYEQTKILAYKKKGVNAMKFLERWIRRGAINVPPYLWLLRSQLALAEGAAFTKVKILFDMAIVGFHRCPFHHLEALACELMAVVAIDHGEHEWVTYYVQKAFGLYKDWGAEAKVAQMRTMFASDLQDESQSRASVSVSSTTRRSFAVSSSTTRNHAARRSSWWCEDSILDFKAVLEFDTATSSGVT